MGLKSTFVGAAKGILNTGKSAAKAGTDAVKSSMLVAIPATTLAAAYMISKLTSPGGVKENVNDILINANEQDILAMSLRDLERLKLRKKLNSKAKPHDQFV